MEMYFLLVFIVIGVGSYGYFWFQKTTTLRYEAEQVIQMATLYTALKSEIDSERSRCENFIAQKEGSFGNFEYCKLFLD
ncbi:MAG: hypothetical protein COU08_03540 [Candidatus Harrisonbacteria bacterium CG10_big_fil_rev_8_21_14_0_10_42_17]|uniref:Uncharacterized protein n=1 Tax=Candidatus Harrisonbacteria bacterium CG10_big_fil_rev_8_21_14_0_10_42_17 TaxID=1974584 RepID=A0A2M6WHL6_9BACT|nr:MAG: hypothetical protein COU08_03540 [Candidatus Harrisonbacteria bacterium CG10_big_fil_rev_8_21_14_0_10_42_17]